MLHLFAHDPAPEPSPRQHPEPVARLASIRNALRVVDVDGGGPAPDFDEQVSGCWDEASAASKRCFDRRSAELVTVAAAGLDAVSYQREQGLDASVAALRVISDELRSGLEDLQRIFSR